MTTLLRYTVTESDTAEALGSGDVPVLATPRLLAWFEAATVRASGTLLPAGSTSVGVEVWLRHRRASAVGAAIEIEVLSVEQDRGLAFELVAWEVPREPGAIGTREIATARVVRAVVDRESFVARVAAAH